MDEFDHFFVSPSDFDRTLSFYADVLGWGIASRWGERGSGRGATLRSGRMQVVIAEKHADDPTDSSNRAINGARPTLYVAVDDLEARFTGLSERSVVVIPPERTHWGIHWFVVRDPDGNLIAFTQKARSSPCLLWTISQREFVGTADGTGPSVAATWGVRPRFGPESTRALTRLGKAERTGPARRFGFGIGSFGNAPRRRRPRSRYVSSRWTSPSDG